MNIREAKLRGIRAAAEVHQKFGITEAVAEGLSQIDVFAILKELDIPVLCRPLDGLLGAYIKDNGAGILVTTKRRLPIQRFTAAHELGHYWLRHEQSFDSEKTLTLARNASPEVSIQEIEAEAFASELLLPKSLIVKTSKKQGWKKSDLEDPRNIYQLALRTGTSYEATTIALISNELIKQETGDVLLQLQPKEIKLNLLGEDASMPSPWSDAFVVTAADSGSEIHASPEDVIVLELNEHASSGYLWSSPEHGKLRVLASVSRAPHQSLLGGKSVRRFYLQGEDVVRISILERRPWEVQRGSNSRFDLDIDFRGKEEGLPRVERSV